MISKKSLWSMLLVSVLFSVSLAGVGVVSASSTSMYIDPPVIWDPNMVPCTTFTMEISVDYVKQLWGYQFTMSFNPDVLHGVSVENGPFLGSEGGSVLVAPGEGFDNEAGTLGLFGAALYPKRFFPTGGGILAYITFHVVGYGASPIRFDANTGLSNKTGGWDFNGETLRYPPNPDFLQHSYFSNVEGPELYIRRRGAHGVSGIWQDWQVGAVGQEQTLHSRIMSYGPMGAMIKVCFMVDSDVFGMLPPIWSDEAWVDPVSLVGDEWIPAEAVLSVSFSPPGPAKYHVMGYIYFKAGEMTSYYPYYRTGLEGEGVSRPTNVAFKVQD
jgi:hypothetical protein